MVHSSGSAGRGAGRAVAAVENDRRGSDPAGLGRDCRQQSLVPVGGCKLSSDLCIELEAAEPAIRHNLRPNLAQDPTSWLLDARLRTTRLRLVRSVDRNAACVTLMASVGNTRASVLRRRSFHSNAVSVYGREEAYSGTGASMLSRGSLPSSVVRPASSATSSQTSLKQDSAAVGT